MWKERLLNNWQLKLLALMLAVITWWTVRQQLPHAW